MNNVVVELLLILNSAVNCLEKLPWSTIVVGIVVPITSAYISYNLAENSIRRKENNRLNVYIEFVRNELKSNALGLSDFVNLKNEKDSVEKELEFPVAFAKNFVIDVLDDLSKIKADYFQFSFGDKIFDKPNILYILGHKIEDVKNKIDEEQFKTYDNELLRNESLATLGKLEKEKENLLREFQNNSTRTVYKEFEAIYKRLYETTNNGKLLEIDKDSSSLKAARKIYDLLANLAENPVKEQKDIINLYDQIPLFSFDDDIVLSEKFEQEEFDLYYKNGFSTKHSDDDLLFLICKKYYKLKRLTNKVSSCGFKWSNSKWDKYSDELVMINNKELYLELNELVDKALNLTDKFISSSIQEKEKIILENFNEFIENINSITKKLKQKQGQIMKNT